ncbi:hypothetical protein [Streptomyces poriticola]|uniref:hypothetical protein n=1 Tax=Streptomyces poriticola TaxID=3120506 RepID=UPI002FCE4A97
MSKWGEWYPRGGMGDFGRHRPETPAEAAARKAAQEKRKDEEHTAYLASDPGNTGEACDYLGMSPGEDV